jgi:protein-L-isoaspartate(D-aspartate) O-methyltransferase
VGAEADGIGQFAELFPTEMPDIVRPAKSRSKVAFAKLRNELVEKGIVARGVRSEPIFRAMRRVAREAFLPQYLREFAYDDIPLPIEQGQTISQPYIVAFMTEALALEGGETVLEIGTGSGYAAAVLAEIAGDVYTGLPQGCWKTCPIPIRSASEVK